MSEGGIGTAGIRQLVQREVRRALDENSQILSVGGQAPDPQDTEDESLELALFLEHDARTALSTGDYNHLDFDVAAAAQRLIERYGLDIEPRTPDWHILCEELIRGEISLLKVHPARVRGDWAQEVEIRKLFNLLEPTGPAGPPEGRPTPSRESPQALCVSEVLDKFLHEKEHRDGLTSKTLREYRTSGSLFADLQGDMAVAAITRDDVRGFRDKLSALPSNLKKIARYRDRPVSEVLQMEIPQEDRRSPRTVAKEIERFSALMGWAVKEGLISANPAISIAPKVESGGYHEFTEAELLKLFALETSARANRLYKFWLPLLGLFTGARIGELVGLTTRDVYLEADLVVLNIREDPEAGHRLKTKAAQRVIPVHPALLSIGLLDYVDALKREGVVALLPDATNSDAASKWFGRHQKSLNLPGRRGGKGFHSFRDNVVTAMTNRSASATLIQEFIGHAHASVTHDRYYAGARPGDLKGLLDHLPWNVPAEGLRGLWPPLLSQFLERSEGSP